MLVGDKLNYRIGQQVHRTIWIFFFFPRVMGKERKNITIDKFIGISSL